MSFSIDGDPDGQIKAPGNREGQGGGLSGSVKRQVRGSNRMRETKDRERGR